MGLNVCLARTMAVGVVGMMSRNGGHPIYLGEVYTSRLMGETDETY